MRHGPGRIAHAAECAVVHAIFAATSVTTPFWHVASYRELYPEAAAGFAAR